MPGFLSVNLLFSLLLSDNILHAEKKESSVNLKIMGLGEKCEQH